jgi:cell division transport system ATP-binding protein
MIQFTDVDKIYQNGTVALKHVNLKIKSGDFVSIVGPSGAGKSTLIRLLIAEERPTNGQIVVGGVNIARMKKKRIPYYRRKLGVIFQDFKLLPRVTVWENVSFAMEVSGESTSTIKKVVPRILNLVGLDGKEDVYPDELSGGEVQRVAIARALAHQPKILIADEPTGNLDPRTAWGITEILNKINDLGTTIIMATHNREIVNKLRRRVIGIEKGAIVYDKDNAGYMI